MPVRHTIRQRYDRKHGKPPPSSTEKHNFFPGKSRDFSLPPLRLQFRSRLHEVQGLETAFLFFHGSLLTLPLWQTHKHPRSEREDNMKQETISGIRTFLAADETVPKDKIETVLRSIRQTTAQHRHLIGARQAMEILGVSRPTLRSYMKQGFITQIAFSSRKVRFDENEIRRFADNGVSSTTSRSRPSSIGTTDTPKATPTEETGLEF